MSARVDGRLYAFRWYSVERVMGVPDGGRTAGVWIVAGTVGCTVGGTVGRYAGTEGGAGGRYCWAVLSSSSGMMCDWCSCEFVALQASGGCWNGCHGGCRLNRHILAPVVSRKPVRRTIPSLLVTVTVCLVKVTLQSASQNNPMLRRLLTKDGIMWQLVVPGGRSGRSSVAFAMDVQVFPLASPTTVGRAL